MWANSLGGTQNRLLEQGCRTLTSGYLSKNLGVSVFRTQKSLPKKKENPRSGGAISTDRHRVCSVPKSASRSGSSLLRSRALPSAGAASCVKPMGIVWTVALPGATGGLSENKGTPPKNNEKRGISCWCPAKTTGKIRVPSKKPDRLVSMP